MAEIVLNGSLLLETNIPGYKKRRGKVREVYFCGDRLVIVTTDGISAFDCVLPTGIPHKGAVLNLLSRFWFEKLRHIVPNHFISTNPSDFPAPFWPFTGQLAHRAMIVERTTVVPFECVVRGYMAGSGWKDYRRTG